MDDLARLLETGETAQVEFKRTLSDERRIIETIAAMATIGGGTILVGVADDGVVVGIDLGEGARERFIQRTLSQTDPKVFVDLTITQRDQKRILRIDVPSGDGPHLAYGRAFYRSGPATVAMTRDEYERRLLDRLREASGYERRLDAGSSLADIDDDAVRRFIAAARARGQRIDDAPHDVLRRLRMSDDEHLTVAGQLTFGRWPQGPFPQAVVRARAERGTTRDSSSIEGRLDEQIEAGVRFVERNLRVIEERESVRRTSRPELPTPAIREALANAVAHRDYRSVAPTQLFLDDDRLTVWNPGHLPAPLTPAALSGPHPSIPPNPLIARALYLQGYIEEWGTGTNRVLETMADNGNPLPLFAEEAGGIRVILPLLSGDPGVLNPRQRAFDAATAAGSELTTAAYAEAHDVSQRTALNDLRELERLGLVSRQGRGRTVRWRKR